MIQGRHFASEQSQGARDYQEDDAGFCPIGEGGAEGLLMVLADGMGGHRGGAHASTAAVETFIDSFNHESGTIAERLSRALEDANDRIGKDSQENPELEGMGCTLVGVSLTEVGIEWISVGDSPMWLVRNGKLQRLNADHSMAPILAKQVELGELTEEEAKRHPQRNALRSAVIGDKMQHVDASKRPMKFRKGDRLLLASDGLETLSVEEIAGLIEEAGEVEAGALAKTLVAAVDARQRKGHENTTVIVIDPYVGGVPAFGVVDPDAVTERVTLRTGPPGSPGEPTTIKAEGGSSPAPRKRGAGRALLMALLVVAGALAVVALVFPDVVDDLLSTGGGGTSAATTAASTAPGTTAQPATTGTPSTARPDKKPPVGGETSGPGGATAGGRTGSDRPRKTPGSVGKTGADTGAKQTPGSGKTLPQSGGGSAKPGGKTAPAPRSGGASGTPDGGNSRKN